MTLVYQNALNKKVIAGTTPALSSDATGDIYYRASDGTLTRLPVGSEGRTLKVVSGLPAWVSLNNYTADNTTITADSTLITADASP